MGTPRQGDLFSDSETARECAECGRSFVPEKDYHEYCEKCWDWRQRRKPRSNESGAQWAERMYGGARTGR